MSRAARNPDTGLTDKEEAFCQYIVCHAECSDSDALRNAYNCSRMKDATIHKKANELKGKAHIQQRLAQLREARCERTQIDADYVLYRLRDIDEMDVADIMTAEGGIKPVLQWPKVWRTTVSGIDLSEIWEGSGDERTVIGVLKKLKWPDKQRNLEMMGKHVTVQAWKEKVEADINATVHEVRRTIVDPKRGKDPVLVAEALP